MDVELHKETAKYMGMNWGGEFKNRLNSFGVLRNRISHGSRLWMIPETVTPKKAARKRFLMRYLRMQTHMVCYLVLLMLLYFRGVKIVEMMLGAGYLSWFRRTLSIINL